MRSQVIPHTGLDRDAYLVQSMNNRIVQIALIGDWSALPSLPSLESLKQQLLSLEARQIIFECKKLERWNSILLVFVLELRRLGSHSGFEINCTNLPQGVNRLLRLAEAVPENEDARSVERDQNFLETLGRSTVSLWRSFVDVLDFSGRMVMVSTQFINRRARYRSVDFLINIQEAGAQALPIISLIGFLMGLILAYVGAVQLKQFGAQIFVADLVAISIVREMGPIMTAVVMAGRTGAAYAAQLGSMKANQEIYAYKTMAISPYQFLVFPRVLALCLMMPLLCIFADAIGIFGGGVVAKFSLGISWLQYITQVQDAIGLPDVLLSLGKAVVFGIIVAMFGCYRGMNSGTSASSVGQAATTAVVSSLVMIVIADAIFAVIVGVLGI